MGSDPTVHRSGLGDLQVQGNKSPAASGAALPCSSPFRRPCRLVLPSPHPVQEGIGMNAKRFQPRRHSAG